MTNIYRPLSQKLLPASGQTLGAMFYVGTFNSDNYGPGYAETDIDVSGFTDAINQGGWEIYVEWRECYENRLDLGWGKEIHTQLFGSVRALDADGNTVVGDVPFTSSLAWGDGMMRGKSWSYSTENRAWITGEPPQVPLGTEFPNMSLQLNKNITTLRVRAYHFPNTPITNWKFVSRDAAVYLVKLPFPLTSLPPPFEPDP